MNQIATTVLLALLRGYQWMLSPMLPPSCRYVPSCSEYAAEAIERHGALRGSVMAILRLLRCHPFAKGGFDPVLCADRTPADRTTQEVGFMNGRERPLTPGKRVGGYRIISS